MSNTLFPGRPNYTGPTKGHFAFVHHSVLFEHSHDIRERIAHIKAHKPLNERATRLEHLMYLDPAQIDFAACEEAWAASEEAWAAYRESLTARGKAWMAHDKAVYSEAWVTCGKGWTAHHKAGVTYKEAQTAAIPTVLAYVNKHFPGHKWNGRTLVFPS